MATHKRQSYKNHVRRDPAFHFILMPILIITVGFAVDHLVHHPTAESAWGVVLSLALILLALLVRMYAARVQDRVIRLEERLRLMALAPERIRERIHELSTKQLVALRFASDEEVAALAERALNEKMTPDRIKRAIEHWRPDHLRV